MFANALPIRAKILREMSYLRRSLLDSTLRRRIIPMAGWSSNSTDDWEPIPCHYRVTNNPVCRPVAVSRPKYFRRPENCRTDEELAEEPRSSLGVYSRCNIPYRPQTKCMSSCGERIDKTMYRPSRSLHRVYQQHWVEEKRYRKPRRRCRIVPAEVSMRLPGKKCDELPKKVCHVYARIKCPKLADFIHRRCPRVRMCHCKPVAGNTSCLRGPKHSKRQRRRTQYPSYSECFSETNAARPCECRCLAVPPLCDMFSFARDQRRPQNNI
ncbi:uncharacterized protein [Drosophila pseudoobscura]|uniref:Uncharacterized protein n=1 Tax=Drosophila pseudoobscura pseudoobscura TaxID=46245 RepID=A0A6I8UTD1_DROPS|nr:uncharacterized protein LOC4803975 [Drosophila pseudoobscura]